MRPAVCLFVTLAVTPFVAFAQDGTDVPRQAGGAGKDLAGRAKSRAAALRNFAYSWRGTPYAWGGTTRDGIDCSGFLREMFRTVYNVELPRTTHDQINMGTEVRVQPSTLGKGFEPGDLFFYVDSTGTPNHVVTYIGQGEFTHSAGGRGVVIEGWRALWGRKVVGRRVLVPARDGAASEGAIPSLAPFRPQEVPCPPDIRASPDEVRRYKNQPIGDASQIGGGELCAMKSLMIALQAAPDAVAQANVAKLKLTIEWLRSLEAGRETFNPSLRR